MGKGYKAHEQNCSALRKGFQQDVNQKREGENVSTG